MDDMDTFDPAQHPRQQNGRFTSIANTPPAGTLTAHDDLDLYEAQDEDLKEKEEQWAADAAAGLIAPPALNETTGGDWDGRPF